MKTQVEFRSSKFPPYDGEEEEINPGLWGKRLAEYLVQKLAERGIETEEMIAEDPIVARLKKRIESMLDKIEVQLSDVHLKIGDKLHMLDKDKDGILTQQEVAGVLQQVLKREITPEEANEIAGEMVRKCGQAKRLS